MLGAHRLPRVVGARLVHHLLGDAQRALLALATCLPPGSAVADRDATTLG